MELFNLEKKIIDYSRKYYEGNPEITDDAFDALVTQLKALNPDSPILKTGWGFEVRGNKVKHKYAHIGSLDKAKSYKEISDRFKNRLIYLSPKLDGLSAVAYYKNGTLVRGITRGNGEYGKDITDKLKMILGETIKDITFTGAVRGELIISNSNWQALKNLKPELISPRNYAAGIVNRNDIDSDITYIDMVVYKIVGQEDSYIKQNRDSILEWLSNNFKCCIPTYFYQVLDETTWNSLHETTYDEFKQFGYGLDGIVLTDRNVLYNKDTQGYVYNEQAFKFQSETAITNIKDIEWTLSRTQRLIPVAIVEPVELAGAVINRVTCNNAKMVQDMNLGKGTNIVITRSNEVIPKIIDVIEEADFNLPQFCPVCNQKLIWDGVDLKCSNESCDNIKYSDLQCWCETVGETDGLQWTLMQQYLDNYKITDIDALYAKSKDVWQDLDCRQLSLTEQKIKEFFKKLYIDPVPIDKALCGLNIPRLGEKTASILSANKAVIIELLWCSMNKPCLEGSRLRECLLGLVKEATTLSLYENLHRFKHLNYIANLADDNKTASKLVFPKSDVLIDKYIGVTGALNTMKRKDFEAYIAKFGYALSTNMKKCLYLINNDIASTSAKNKQAKELAIPIVTEQEFLSMLSGD